MEQQPISIVNNPSTTADHDLLIQIATKLDRAIADIKELKDQTSERVKNLEDEKLNRSEFDEARTASFALHDDHEKRLRFLERYIWGAIAIVGAIELYLTYRQIHP